MVCRVRSSAMQRSAHYSGCRLARGLDVHPYVLAPAVAGPKVQRHDGAVVGPARSAARGPACSSTAHGPARDAARVSPKKPSRSRPVVRPGCPSMVLGETVKDVSSHHGPGREASLITHRHHWSTIATCYGPWSESDRPDCEDSEQARPRPMFRLVARSVYHRRSPAAVP